MTRFALSLEKPIKEVECDDAMSETNIAPGPEVVEAILLKRMD